MSHSYPKTLKTIIALLLLCSIPGSILAGEIHEGQGASKIAAVQAANRAALAAAKTKDTGWKPARLQDVIRNKDGTWTARADSANHKSSLGGGGYRLPGDALPQFDDVTPKAAENQDSSIFEQEALIAGNWSGKRSFVPNGHYWSNGSLRGTWAIVDSDVVLTFGNPHSPDFETQMPKKTLRLKLSADKTELTGQEVVQGTPQDVLMKREADGRKHLHYAVVYERWGKDISKARVVVDKVEESGGIRALMEKSLAHQVQSSFQTLNDTWVIKVIPDSVHAVIYSFEMNAGRTLGIAVAEGVTQEKAESNMESQLQRFGRKNASIIRTWPPPFIPQPSAPGILFVK